MKSNWIKYIFILFVIGLIGFAVYTFYHDEKQKREQENAVQNVDNIENTASDIRISIVNYDTMNPLLSNNRNVQEISRLLYEPLLALDQNYKLQPALATEWSKTGDTMYVLKLRENVKWQDGSKFTANDVQFTIDRLKDTPSIYSYNVIHVVGVEVIDDYTIKINLDAKVPFFEYNLIFPILNRNSYENQDFATTEINKAPLATGMYKIDTNEGNTITLKKNENYWNKIEKNTKTETILVNLYTSMGEAYNNFKMGNVDLLTTESLNVENYIGMMGYNKKEYIGRQHDFVALNCSNNLLSRPEIRKAVSYAIDKSGVMSSVYNGQYYTAEFPLDYGNWAYPVESGSIGYNPDQAKQILIDNGWQYKYSNWQKIEDYKTVRLNLELVVNVDNSMQVAAADIIKANLENVGIKIKLIKVNSNQYNNYIQNKNFNMILTGTNVALSPYLDTYFGENNLASYQNNEVTSIMNELNDVTNNDSLVKEKVTKLGEIYKNDAPYISLYFNKNTFVYSNNLIGDMNPNNYNIFYGIENWYRHN